MFLIKTIESPCHERHGDSCDVDLTVTSKIPVEMLPKVWYTDTKDKICWGRCPMGLLPMSADILPPSGRIEEKAGLTIKEVDRLRIDAGE